MTELDDRDRSRLARSGLASSILWVIVIAAMTLIPARSPREMEIEEFPVVKLTLNRVSASATQSSATQAPATAETVPAESSAQAQPAPKASKPEKAAQPAPARKAPAAVKPASTKSPAKAAPAKNTVKPVPGDLGIPDFGKPAATRAKADSREGELVFTGSSEESIVPRPKTARQAVPEFEGKAAVVERESAAAPVVSSRGQSHPGVSTEGVSADTERSLSAIGGSAGRGTPDADSPAPGTGGPSSTGQTPRSGGGPKADAGDGSSSIGAITFEGAPRRLVYPAKPSIVLPDRLSRLIDSDRTVTVSMTVAADGTVPASMISFSPAALLPPEVRDFLGAEFSRWRFEQGRGDGQARFLYSIRVQ